MNEHSKLRHQSKEENTLRDGLEQRTEAKEFNSVEDMLRYDAANTVPPESVARRLADSLEKEPVRKSWFHRLFGKL